MPKRPFSQSMILRGNEECSLMRGSFPLTSFAAAERRTRNSTSFRAAIQQNSLLLVGEGSSMPKRKITYMNYGTLRDYKHIFIIC